jgi:hypothetical protein
MTTEKSGFWIAAKELTRQPGEEGEATTERDRKRARSTDFPF